MTCDTEEIAVQRDFFSKELSSKEDGRCEINLIVASNRKRNVAENVATKDRQGRWKDGNRILSLFLITESEAYIPRDDTYNRCLKLSNRAPL